MVRQLTELRAGPLGRLVGLAAKPLMDEDALLGPSSHWTSATSYTATKNLKKHDIPAVVVRDDVKTECHRRGLPAPREVEVIDVIAGPRGGRPTAKLKLRFNSPVRGPILIGRESHSGGRIVPCRGMTGP